MATVIDTIPGPDGREVEITIEPGEIALVVRSPDHAQPERAVLSWDEFDTVTDRLRAWRRLLAPAAADPTDEIAAFVAALGSEGRK
jgi:hypothetical protein